MNSKDKLANYEQEFCKARDNYIEKYSEEFVNFVKEQIFDKYSFIKSFSWTQYTPYFNDGSECQFEVNGINKINGVEIDFSEIYRNSFVETYVLRKITENDSKYTLVTNENFNQTYKNCMDDLHSIVSDLPKEVALGKWGDHVEVNVGIDVNNNVIITIENYEHD